MEVEGAYVGHIHLSDAADDLRGFTLNLKRAIHLHRIGKAGVVTAFKQPGAICIVNKAGVQPEASLIVGVNGSEANLGGRKKCCGKNVSGQVCAADEALKIVMKIENEVPNRAARLDHVRQIAAWARLRLGRPIL